MLGLKKFYCYNKFAPALLIFFVAVCLSVILRCLLLVQVESQTSLSAAQLLYAFGVGLLYDVCLSTFIMIPFVLQIAVSSERLYRRPYKQIVTGIFLVLLFVLFFTTLIPKEYNADLYLALEIYLLLRLAIFTTLTFTCFKNRQRWRKAVLMAGFLLVTILLVFNAVSEWFFWNEFAARYNFIAVDYLIYTTEVIGNITESYPVIWISLAIVVVAAGIVILARKNIADSVNGSDSITHRLLYATVLLMLPFIAWNILSPTWMQKSDNNYANELAGNGLFTFAKAFTNNELDFYKYYDTLPDKEAFAIVRQNLSSPNVSFIGTDSLSIERNIHYTEPATNMNVVLISVESLSASFMNAFGSTKNITPQLDSLAQHSLMFTNFYASGTRTVRGLEAITLSIPPTPGQSTVKRPDNHNLFSLGAVLKDKGYSTQYIYGGYAYFDNMKDFFSGNGYDVIDRDALKPEDIDYANVWGVADEDLFNLSLRTMDSNYATGKPFFSHIMTVSNHRPFTYPDGRIDIPSAAHSREGAVKYTDYAIGKFIASAKLKPWFNNTIFVIVADHCASSAGSVDLPVTGYHIPMLMYSPAHLQPQQVTALTTQIDIAPTILGLLKMSYRSKFFGKDIFDHPSEQRAFISTYQGLGFLKNNELIVQSPVKKVTEFIPDFTSGNSKKTILNDALKKEAIAYYQCASWLLKHRKYNFR